MQKDDLGDNEPFVHNLALRIKIKFQIFFVSSGRLFALVEKLFTSANTD